MGSSLPIDMEIIHKSLEIPKQIAKLTYIEPTKAIYYMQVWGEKRLPIKELHDELYNELSKEEGA